MSIINEQLKYFSEYLRIEENTSPATIRNYLYYLQRFFKWSMISDPRDITVDYVERFKQYLSALRNNRGELMKQTTQNYHLIALRKFLEYLHKQNIETLTHKEVRLEKTQKRHAPSLEKDTLEKLLDAPLRTKNTGVLQKRDKALLELLFSTGMKVSELSSLKINNIHYLKDELYVRSSGDKSRAVPFSNLAKYWIKQYLEARNDSIPALFIRHDKAKTKQLKSISADDYQLTPRTIQRIVKKYVTSAGLDPNVTPQSLRRTYAVLLLKRGDDLSSIQSTLGHTSIATTKLYR